jgi:hypothetical protein
MKVPPSIPSLEQALNDLKPVIGRLFSSWDHAVAEARETADQKGYDGSYFSHQVRFEAKIDLKGQGIEADDCELENTPNTGICVSVPGYSIRVLRSQNGEIPDPGDSDRRIRFLEQKSEQLRLFPEQASSDELPEHEPVHIVVLWEDVRRFFSGFWFICPDGVSKHHFKQWLPRPELGQASAPLAPPVPPSPPDDLSGIRRRQDTLIRKTGSDDPEKQ